jgi:hypothetical protein
MAYLRVNALKAVEVAVSAEDFWKILIDWGALMDWIPKLDENPPAPVSGCEVLPGHSLENLPFTRRVHLENDGVGPAYLDETLEHFDDETRRLYYTFGGVGPGGVRNYHATTFVDVLDANFCRVTCACQYDIADDAGTDMKDFIEEFYDRAIIQGIARLAQKRAG